MGYYINDMRIEVLKSKIHGARVTRANLHYEGSLTIDQKLMEAAEILPYEKVHLLNSNTGSRLETYAIPGGPGEIVLNGAAARMGEVGDELIILCYAQLEQDELSAHKPKIVIVDEQNRIICERTAVKRA